MQPQIGNPILKPILQKTPHTMLQSQDKKLDLRYICNQVPKCKCHDGIKFAIGANSCANLINNVKHIYNYIRFLYLKIIFNYIMS